MNPASRTDKISRMSSRRRPRTILTGAVLLALLVPLGYVFTQFWSATRDTAALVETEHTGIGYVRPVTGLLAVLVDAQSAHVRGEVFDAAKVRGAIEEVNRADRGSSDELGQIEQRWAQLTQQIESALAYKGSGQKAMQAYAIPIELTQALLVRIGDSSELIRDPAAGAYHLADAALVRIPEVIVSAGKLAAHAGTADARTDPSPSGSAVARERVSSAADAMNIGLRSRTDSTAGAAVGMTLLKPLDDFGAAVGAIVQASLVPDLSNDVAQAQVDAARHAVQAAALELSDAVITSFGHLLSQRADDLAAQQRNVLVAGVLALLAAVVLLWLCLPVQSVTPNREVRDSDTGVWAAPGSDDYPPEVVHVGRATWQGRRRHNGPQ